MLGAVVHVPDTRRVRQALANARNILDDLPGVEVALVVNGDAVEALAATSDHADAVGALVGRGARVLACERALRRHGVDPGSLVAGVEVVPGGASEAVRLQGEGWAYLRP